MPRCILEQGQGAQDTLPTVVQGEGKGSENAENLECDVETAYHKEHGLS